MKNLLAYITSFKAKKVQLKNLEAEVDEMQKELLGYIGSNYEKDESGKIRFTVGQYTVTLTTVEKTSVDKKALEAKYPEIAEEFKKVSTYDRLTVG